MKLNTNEVYYEDENFLIEKMMPVEMQGVTYEYEVSEKDTGRSFITTQEDVDELKYKKNLGKVLESEK